VTRLAWVVASLIAGASVNGLAATCTVTALPVAFGTYNPASATPRDASGRVTLRCTATGPAERVAATVALGTGVSGNAAARTLLSAGQPLNYNLFTTNARTLVWGDGSGGTRTVALNLNLPANGTRTVNRTVFGRIPALQNPIPGSYSDAIVVTVTY
jgi:spore coat protein U-like protein